MSTPSSAANADAVAITNARLHESLRARERELALTLESNTRILHALAAAARVAGAARDPAAVYCRIGEELKRLGMDCAVVLFDRERRLGRVEYVSFAPDLVRRLEKITGLRAEGFEFAVDQLPLYAETLAQREARFASESLEPGVRTVLPPRLRKFGALIVRTLGLRRGVLAPLLSQADVIGWLWVVSDRLSEADAPTMTIFAQQVAAALENARLVQQVEQRNRELEALREVAGALARVVEPHALAARIPQELAKIVACDRAGFYLYDAEAGRLTLAAALGLTEKERQIAAASALERHPGWVVRNRQPLLVADARHDPRVRYVDGQPRAQSLAYVPILFEDRCLGAIAASSDHLAAFDERTIETLTMFANHAALALENARLYDSVRAKAEALEAANRRLRELDQLKSDFVATVSHDLRAPLTAIKGFVSSLLQPDVAWDGESAREFLEAANLEADELARMIENLLDMSRIEAGLLAPNLQTVRLEEIVTAAANGACGASAGSGRGPAGADRLRVRLPARLPPLRADPLLVRSVLVNLIDNALKYAPPGTPITIGARSTEGWVTVCVADEGPGVPPEHRERVFERFYRLTGQGPPGPTGTGLGLAICRAYVEAHGGRIWIESTPGRGATVCFTLPAGGDHPTRQL